MARFDGKVVVITGGTSGIGLATAQAFQKEGAKVVVTGRSSETLTSARELLGTKATVLRSDTANFKDLDELAAQIRESHGGLDVLFANAGIAKFAPLEGSTAELFDETFNINVRGLFFTVQKLAPLIRPGGAVVLNTSVVAQKGFPGTAVYSASKAAVRSFTRTLAAELMQKSIRVNAVSPGPITTPIYAKLGLGAGQAGFEKQMAEMNPMKRFGKTEEVAAAVLFLASAEATYTTGVELAVDGGVTSL